MAISVHKNSFKKFCEFCFLVNGLVCAGEEMQGDPSGGIQQQAEVKTRWDAEMVTIYNGA